MAWTTVGVSGPVTAASGNLTLTEPAGVQEGDLLVACISYRSNAAFTLPSGWTLVATQQSGGNTTANGTGSIGSGLMAWIVRGAAAPALTFTRSGGDVALGRIQAYRGQASSPYDAGVAETLAAATTAVSVAGLTTAEANELLVFAACGARNSSFTNFDAATDPTTASGTGANDTNDPSVGTWRERADSGTTTGADCSLGIADAIRGTAGATGNFTVTASSSARHVVIVGAFRMAVDHQVAPLGISAGAPMLGVPALAQDHVVAPAGLATAAPVVAAPTVSQDHVVAPAGLATAAPALGTPTVEEAGGEVAVTPQSIAAGAPVLGAPTVTDSAGGVAVRVQITAAAPGPAHILLILPPRIDVAARLPARLHIEATLPARLHIEATLA
jgi:hypothetical protein